MEKAMTMKTQAEFTFERISGPLFDQHGYRIANDYGFRLTIKDAAGAIAAQHIGTLDDWQSFFDTAADVIRTGKAETICVISTHGVPKSQFGSLMLSGSPEMGRAAGAEIGVIPPTDIDMRPFKIGALDVLRCISCGLTPEQVRSASGQHAGFCTALQSFGLAPLKEEGKLACCLCDSTACVKVGGTEPCPVSEHEPLGALVSRRFLGRAPTRLDLPTTIRQRVSDDMFLLDERGVKTAHKVCGYCWGIEGIDVPQHARNCERPQADPTHDSGELPRR